MASPAKRDLIVIGGSAGALPVLRTIFAQLPSNLAAAILVVLHISREPGALAPILDRFTPLTVRFPRGRDPLRSGEVLVAPPDRHLVVHGTTVRITRGPRESGFRPAIDPLFRTAAENYGRRVLGLVLSGALEDGTVGLDLIRQAGGLAVVQKPEDAAFPSMPLAALRKVEADAVLPAAEIAPFLIEAAGVGPARRVAAPDGGAQETRAKADAIRAGPPRG